MKALSIRQPWAWAILHAGKDVENRDWYTPFRGKFAIHAAKGMTKDEYREAMAYIRHRFVANVLRNPVTVQLGEGRLSLASGELVTPGFSEITRGAIVGVAYVTDCVQACNSPWFQGLWGFEIENVIALPEPIPCKGALGFWDAPEVIVQQIASSALGVDF
jgi:hypothetical protein